VDKLLKGELLKPVLYRRVADKPADAVTFAVE
jgi:hypothetical protein